MKIFTCYPMISLLLSSVFVISSADFTKQASINNRNNPPLQSQLHGKRQQSFSGNQFKQSHLQKGTQTSSPATSKWYVLTAPDGDFTVEFPSKPIHEPDVQGVNATIRGYSLTKDSIRFDLLFVDVDAEPNSRKGNKFPGDFGESRIRDAKERGYRIIRAQLLRTNVYELEAWAPLHKDPSHSLHVIEHNVVRYGQLYTLICTSLTPDRKLDRSVYQRFFDSFRTIKPPQPQVI